MVADKPTKKKTKKFKKNIQKKNKLSPVTKQETNDFALSVARRRVLSLDKGIGACLKIARRFSNNRHIKLRTKIPNINK